MPYYGPDEPKSTIFLEQTFVSGDFVAGVGYGIQLVLYTQCTLYLLRQLKRRRGVMLFLLGYITVLISLQSMAVSAATWTTVDAYVNNRNYSGGPWAWFLATQTLPEDVLFIVSIFVLTFLSDLLVLWRCWVIWTYPSRAIAYAVTALPCVILLGSFALGTIWCLQSSQPGLSLYSKVPVAFGTSYFMTSLGVNIIATILIVIRLLMLRRAITASLPPEHAKHYLSIATILVESAALYSICALAFIITYAINNPMNQFFLAISGISQQVAGYLIILRLAQGTAWNPNTLGVATGITPQLTTIQFSVPVSSTDFDSVINMTNPDGTVLLVKPEIKPVAFGSPFERAVFDNIPKGDA